MARITTVYCTVCGETKQECVGGGEWPTVCGECASKAKSEARIRHLKGLEALTLEQRIAKIEAWQYDYRPPVSIHDMRF